MSENKITYQGDDNPEEADKCPCGKTQFECRETLSGEGSALFCISCGWKKGFHPSLISPERAPGEPLLEAISREARNERDRCIQIVWDNRGKCASNQAALALMDALNGPT